jgi:intein/homing endonuclease
MSKVLTQEEQVKLIAQEFKRCREDPVYFICKYIKVVHAVRGLVNFELYPFQKRILQEFTEHRFTVLRKFRQAGCTTLSCAYALWFCLFQAKKTVAVLSKGDAESTEFLDRIKVMYDELPVFLKPDMKENNKHTLKFTNGSTIKSRASGKQSGRSLAGSLLIIDEAAFIDNMKTIWAAALPVVSCVSKDTLILTDDGYRKIGDYFTENDKPGEFKNLDLQVVGSEGLEQVIKGYVSPRSKTLIIQTAKGFELEVTEHHPLYSLTKTGPEMVVSGDLKFGDYLRIDHSMNIFGKNKLDSDLAYMLGGYIAEGWSKFSTKNYHITVSNQDSEFREVYLRNGFYPIKNTIKLTKSSKSTLTTWMSLGIDPKKKCDTKEIPSHILSCDKKTQGMFLRGLFDGDGSITDKGDICLVSTSKRLVKQTQLLLINFGILSVIHLTPKEKILKYGKSRIMPGGEPMQSARDSYKLVIRRSQAAIFKTEIGFNIKRKQDRLEILCLNNKDCHKLFSVPKKFVKTDLFKILEQVDVPISFYRKNGIRLDKLLDENENRTIPVYLLEKIKSLLQKNFTAVYDKNKLFFDDYCRNSTWDYIVKITESENETVDLTVPKTSSFLQNGILGSNTGGKVLVLSTVNGIANWFFEIYSGAIKGTNSFHPIDIKWQEHPEYFRHESYQHLYDEMLKRSPPKNIDDWEKEMRGNLKPKEWKQEFEAEFLGTGDTYIDGEILGQLNENVSSKFYERYNGRLRVWSNPNPNRLYGLAADVSLGRGFDHSAFHILDLYTGIQVAEFYSPDTPINEFAKIIALEGRRYNVANVIAERNMIGHVLIKHLLNDHEYENMWTDEKGEVGILVSAKNRETLLAEMEEQLRLCSVKVNSERTLFELYTFIINEETKKPEADEGKTDDLVMSLAFAAQLRKGMPTLVDMTKDVTDFSILGIVPGRKRSTYTITIPTKNGPIEEDISWVLKN